MSGLLRKTFVFLAITLALGLVAKYFLPVMLPFLLGAAIAWLAEPVVAPVAKRWKRGWAAGLGVTLTLAGVGVLLALLGTLAVRQVGRLAQKVPELTQSAQQALTALQDWLVNLAEQAPEPVRPRLQQTVLTFFSDGSGLVQQLGQHIPGVVTSAIGTVGNGALSVGTGILSAYLISARLPKLKAGIAARLPDSWREKTLPALRRVKTALSGWLRAQLKLCAVTWVIVGVGFLVLRIPGAIGWALVVPGHLDHL